MRISVPTRVWLIHREKRRLFVSDSMNRFIILYLYVSHIYSVNQCQTTFVTPPPFRLIYMLSYERNPTTLILSTILHPIKLYYTFLKMISSAALVARAAVCHSTFGSLHFRDSRNIKKWRVYGNQLLFLDDTVKTSSINCNLSSRSVYNRLSNSSFKYLIWLNMQNSEIHGFVPAGRRYHEGSVHQCVELRFYCVLR